MKKIRQPVRQDDAVLIGISGGSYATPEPRVTAFVWSDERDLEQVLADLKSAA